MEKVILVFFSVKIKLNWPKMKITKTEKHLFFKFKFRWCSVKQVLMDAQWGFENIQFTSDSLVFEEYILPI